MIRMLGLCFFAITAVLLNTPAGADGLSVTISPLNAELAVKAGVVTTGVISVTNNLVPQQSVLMSGPSDDASTAHLKVYAIDWTLDQKGNISFLPTGTSPDC